MPLDIYDIGGGTGSVSSGGRGGGGSSGGGIVPKIDFGDVGNTRGRASSPLDEVTKAMAEMQKRDAKTIETNFKDISKAQDDFTKINAVTEKDKLALKEAKEEYGIDDNMFNLSLEQLSNPYSSISIRGKLNRFLNDPRVKEAVASSKIFDETRKSIDKLKGSKRAAMYDFNMIIDDPNKTLYDFNVSDYEPIDIKGILKKELEGMMKNNMDMTVEEDNNGHGYIVFKKREQSDIEDIIKPGDFADMVVDRYIDDKKVQNSLRNIVGDGGVIEDEGAIKQYLTEIANQVFDEVKPGKIDRVTGVEIKQDEEFGYKVRTEYAAKDRDNDYANKLRIFNDIDKPISTHNANEKIRVDNAKTGNEINVVKEKSIAALEKIQASLMAKLAVAKTDKEKAQIRLQIAETGKAKAQLEKEKKGTVAKTIVEHTHTGGFNDRYDVNYNGTKGGNNDKKGNGGGSPVINKSPEEIKNSTGKTPDEITKMNPKEREDWFKALPDDKKKDVEGAIIESRINDAGDAYRVAVNNALRKSNLTIQDIMSMDLKQVTAAGGKDKHILESLWGLVNSVTGRFRDQQNNKTSEKGTNTNKTNTTNNNKGNNKGNKYNVNTAPPKKSPPPNSNVNR